jgi:hypothetical protein
MGPSFLYGRIISSEGGNDESSFWMKGRIAKIDPSLLSG